MATEEGRRAGEVVAARMNDLGLTAVQLAQKARVHPSTIRAMLRGTRWLNVDTWGRVAAALDWEPTEVTRRVWAGRAILRDASTDDLIRELCRRYGQQTDARGK